MKPLLWCNGHDVEAVRFQDGVMLPPEKVMGDYPVRRLLRPATEDDMVAESTKRWLTDFGTYVQVD